MIDRRFAIAAVIAALFFGVLIGYFNSGRSQSGGNYSEDLASLQNQLDFERQDLEQRQKEWDAADAAFLAQNTFFQVEAKSIIDGIIAKYAVNQPVSSGPHSVVKTNLGAEVHIYDNGKNVTLATVSFPESKRDHGIEIVGVVAARLHIPMQPTMDVVSFASYRTDYHGVVLYRCETAIVGTVARNEGNYKKVTVNFTPTRNVAAPPRTEYIPADVMKRASEEKLDIADAKREADYRASHETPGLTPEEDREVKPPPKMPVDQWIPLKRKQAFDKAIRLAESRRWITFGGTAASEARITNYQNGVFTLTNADGKTKDVRLSRFIGADRAYVDQWLTEAKINPQLEKQQGYK